MENLLLGGLNHLFMMVFLYNFSVFMVVPAITDVTMSALCPGEDECSIAIYLTGIQQAIVGLGTLLIMPIMGHLSDTFGRKAMLTIPMALTILPLAILAYSRERNYFYAYYVLKTFTSMICEGSVQCLSLAYVADNVPEHRRASVFGILTGISSCAFVCGNLSTRFLPTASAFQISAFLAAVSTLYMRFFLPETIANNVSTLQSANKGESEATLSLLGENDKSRNNERIFRKLPSFHDSVSLLRSSLTFSQAAVVAFFLSLGDVGLHSSLLYYLKACFHFDKDQFADLMVVSGIAGTVSQMLLMPLLAPILGDEKLLSIGIIFSCAHMVLYSIAWSSWVPYAAAMFSLLGVFAHPCLRSIASKQVGPEEQGKAQGCISGLCSFANVLSPLVFSPLTALFLSMDAPFDFPGFSIACAGFALMIAFVQSIVIKATPTLVNSKSNTCVVCV